MKFKTKESKGVTVIELSGNVLGGPDANELNNKLHELVSAEKKKIVVDLDGVKFINSSGLSMLIGGLNVMRKSGGELKLARASKKIESILQMTKLTNVFDIHKQVAGAVKAFK